MHSRRQFIKTTGLAVAASVVHPFATRAATRRRGTFTALRRGVGMFEARGGTIGYLADSDGVVMIDSQYPDTAADCVAGLAEQAGRSIDLFINTHHHGDHTSGNSVVSDSGTLMVAHRNVPELQRSSAEAQDRLEGQVYADTLFDESWEMEIGGELVRLSHFGPGHTAGDAVVHFENADVVHMGDLVFNRMPPFIDRPAGASVSGWIGALETVHAAHSDETLFIFGHGNPAFGATGGRGDLLTMRDFLSAMLDHARSGLKEGKSLDEIAVPRVPGFEEHYLASWADGIPNAIRAAVAELQADQ